MFKSFIIIKIMVNLSKYLLGLRKYVLYIWYKYVYVCVYMCIYIYICLNFLDYTLYLVIQMSDYHYFCLLERLSFQKGIIKYSGKSVI